MWSNPQESKDLVSFTEKSLMENDPFCVAYVKSRPIFKKNTKFTGEYTFKIRFSHELENKGRFSNLH